MLVYGVHDSAGEDVGTLLHPAPNFGPGDVVVLEDGWEEALVTARVETDGHDPFAALLEVAVAPMPLTADDSIA